MHKNIVLDSQQRLLVEDYLSVVDWVLLDYIKANEGIVGLGQEDLRQEGYVWLCQAAASYNGTSASFGTYARKVVRNGLLSYCRTVGRHPPILSLDSPQPPDSSASGPRAEPSIEDGTDDLIDLADTAALLFRMKRKYSGVTKLGIEALALKIKGLDGADIAMLYGVQSNHVSAWISRAAQKLRGDEQFLAYFRRNATD